MTLWAYFAAARALHVGASPYVDADILARYVPEASELLPPYIYPPTLAIALAPVATLPLSIAVGLWVGCVALFTLALIPLLRPWLPWPVALIAVLGFSPAWASLWYGQINAVIAVLLVLATRAYCRQQPLRAGTWLGIGMMLKITPALLLWVAIMHKSWRTLLGALGCGILIVLSTLLFIPLEVWRTGVLYALLNPSTNLWCVSYTALLSRIEHPAGIIAANVLSSCY